MIKSKLLFLLFFAPFVYAPVHAASLCSLGETNVFSFQIKGKEKYVSICEGKWGTYLVYRFGSPNAIELSFPDQKDDASWKAFAFNGYQRPGGAANDGMGDYSLSFSKGAYTYTVFQQWRDSDKSYDIGVLVVSPKKSISIHGIEDTQSGTLVRLDGNAKLPNQGNP